MSNEKTKQRIREDVKILLRRYGLGMRARETIITQLADTHHLSFNSANAYLVQGKRKEATRGRIG
jgi:hypothetical protein